MNDDLKRYIQEMVNLEYDFSFIKEELLRTGWDESSIERAFHEYHEFEKAESSEDDEANRVYEEQVSKPVPEESLEQDSEKAHEKGNEDAEVSSVDAKEVQEDGTLMGILPEKDKKDVEIPRGAEELKHPPKTESKAIPLKEIKNTQPKEISKKEKSNMKPVEEAAVKHSVTVPLLAGLLSLVAGIAFGYFYLSMNFYDLSFQPPELPEEELAQK